MLTGPVVIVVFWSIVLFAVLSFANVCRAGNKDVHPGEFEAEVVRVIDGDTIVVNIEGWPSIVGKEIGIRVYGIDTRELNDGGNSSKEYAKSLVQPGDMVLLTRMSRGKFFRIVARVRFGKEYAIDWETHFLEKGLAYPYFGGTKRPLGWKPEDYRE